MKQQHLEEINKRLIAEASTQQARLVQAETTLAKLRVAHKRKGHARLAYKVGMSKDNLHQAQVIADASNKWLTARIMWEAAVDALLAEPQPASDFFEPFVKARREYPVNMDDRPSWRVSSATMRNIKLALHETGSSIVNIDTDRNSRARHISILNLPVWIDNDLAHGVVHLFTGDYTFGFELPIPTP